MEFISIFNDVLGPVMRGPSSSHTAGSYRIGKIVRSLLGEEPSSVKFTFDPQGSYIKTYRQQGADIAFAAGIMELPITDDRFPQALELADIKGIKIEFTSAPLEKADHPNTVKIQMTSRSGKQLSAAAKSVGGGVVLVYQIEDWFVNLTGKAYEILVECDKSAESQVIKLLTSDGLFMDTPVRQTRDNNVLLHVQRVSSLNSEVQTRIETLPGVKNIRTVSPVFFIQRGKSLFSGAEEMVAEAEKNDCSLGKIALVYESELLGMTESETLEEMIKRFEIMKSSVYRGLDEKDVRMQLLEPSARRIYNAEAEGKVAVGGIHTRAAARSMAVMHVNSSMGVVCAAPTGASSGVIPGVVVTLAEEKNLSEEETAAALFAASAVGLVVARRATFAAEVAGCQVEIGAAGAMAAAAVVEAAGGSARQAVDAAAIAFQNVMGSVCDLIQGICEIPCHTRNAAAASSAFLCADLILGGYHNPVPLDETIDAVYAVGKMLPCELRCTALGGIAVTPSALALHRLR
ncbi:hypothetical protein AMJ80_09805 [bacterium SM23_31]|nr:MAG: hypothetical protein AMJ80_09805 [bacterium SM23_31]